MYGYIYKITNTITNKSYIGKHKYSKKELDPRYLTGGILIRKSINKYGIENFTRELIDTADTLDDLNNKEIYYINYYQTKTPIGYNLTRGGDGLVDPSPEIRLKLAYWKNKNMSKESNLKRSNTLKQVKHTQDWIQKISNSNKGHKPSEYCKKQSSIAHKNTHWYNNGSIEKMVFDDNIPEGWVIGRLPGLLKAHNKGKRSSAESVLKMRTSKRGKIWYNNGLKEIMLNPDIDNIPNNFTRGRLKHSK